MSRRKAADPFGVIMDQHERMTRAATGAPAVPLKREPEPEQPRFGDVGGTARGIWRSRCEFCGDPLCQGECLPDTTWLCKNCQVEQVTIPGTACMPCVATLYRNGEGKIVYGTPEGKRR